jgi:hypothetical protein
VLKRFWLLIGIKRQSLLFGGVQILLCFLEVQDMLESNSWIWNGNIKKMWHTKKFDDCLDVYTSNCTKVVNSQTTAFKVNF